jgi:type I site-specific restriction endonuclease
MRGKKWGDNTNMFDEMNVISSYPLQQAVEDGVLVEIFKNRWKGVVR